jgi:CheY-like chemotaxis protein
MVPQKHILIVDDDYLNSFALKEYLEALGYEVSTAENCKQATQTLLGIKQIDLVILDYLMPDGNGTELLHELDLRGGIQKPPVIMSSSILDRQNPFWEALLKRMPSGTQSLIQGYLSKPYSFENMNEIVQGALKAGEQILTGDYLSPALNSKPPVANKEKAA